MPNMITVLLGNNSIAKKAHIADSAVKFKADLVVLDESSELSGLSRHFEPQLFGAPKIVVLDGAWKNIDAENFIDQVGECQVFIVEENIDKRKKVNTEFLKDSRVLVLNFDAPVGSALSADWILKFAKEHNIAIEPAAARALATALLENEDSSLNVARAQNELQKLQSFANGKTITTAMVGELTENITGVDIFALLNAIATKNKKLALQMLEQFFETETADEKSNAIKVAALLSDQFRSLLVINDASNRNLPDEKILDLTGWKSGRLYVLKKLSRNFSSGQLKSSLAKLENLDRELKTGSMPPQVILDLIIADI